MVVTCPKCQKSYDDARRWTICPHPSLDAPYDGRLRDRTIRGHTPIEEAAVDLIDVISHHSIEPDGCYSRINTTELTQAVARLEALIRDKNAKSFPYHAILSRSVLHSAPDGSSVVKHETVTVSIASPVDLFTPDAAYERHGAWRILQPVQEVRPS